MKFLISKEEPGNMLKREKSKWNFFFLFNYLVFTWGFHISAADPNVD